VNEARRVEKLRTDHSTESFDCGREELNRCLLRYAWQNQQAGAAQTYVGLAGDAVIGYYTLAVGHVTREEAPERLTKGLARHPVPISSCSSRCDGLFRGSSGLVTEGWAAQERGEEVLGLMKRLRLHGTQFVDSFRHFQESLLVAQVWHWDAHSCENDGKGAVLS
jgi:hypothetical protein